MTDTKQSEAPRLTDEGESGVEHKDKRTEQLMRELAAECRISAEQKLRADQLAQQHRMQREINHADGETILALRAENEQLRAALTEAVPDDAPSQPKADSKDFPAEWAVALWKGRERIRKELRASNGQAPAQPSPTSQEDAPEVLDVPDQCPYFGPSPHRDVWLDGWYAARAAQAGGWMPIETAPTNGRTLLLGYFNSAGNWRTTRGEWMSQDYIDEYAEDPDCMSPGWHETTVEGDDGKCWPIDPTHWMPLPPPPTSVRGREP